MPTLTLTDTVTKAKSLTVTDPATNAKRRYTLPPSAGIVELWDTVVPSLALRIGYGGRRTYTVTTRVNGKLVRRKVGTTDTHGLAEARDAARDIIREAAKGIDSASKQAKKEAAERERQEAARADAGTFQAVAEAWLADTGKGGGGKNRSKGAVEARLKRDVYPKIGALPIAGITDANVSALLDDIARDRPIAANRALASIRRIFTWAVKKKRLTASPVVGIDPPAEERSRERVLKDAEIARLWPAIEGLGYPFAPLLKLLLLTGQRREEMK